MKNISLFLNTFPLNQNNQRQSVSDLKKSTSPFFGADSSKRKIPMVPPDEFRRQNVQRPLHYFVSEGLSGELADRLKGGWDPNMQDGDGNTPLHLAAASGDLESANVLLKRRTIMIDPKIPNNEGQTPLEISDAKKKKEDQKFKADSTYQKNKKYEKFSNFVRDRMKALKISPMGFDYRK